MLVGSRQTNDKNQGIFSSSSNPLTQRITHVSVDDSKPASNSSSHKAPTHALIARFS